MCTVAVAAVDFGNFTVFQNDLYHPGTIQLAAVTGNKKIEPLHVKDLLGITGYIRGGCSPVGMKKKFPTYFDVSAGNVERLTVSAGVRGIQLLISSDDVIKFTNATLVDVTAE